MSNLIIIDFYNTLTRMLSVHKHLSWEGQSTGGFYGFITQLTGLIHAADLVDKQFKVIICKDKKPYIRQKYYPEYKGDRKKNYDDPEVKAFYQAMNENAQMIKEFAELTDIPIWSIEGLEADDLITYLVLLGLIDNAYILSNDTDLYQLFGMYPILKDLLGNEYSPKIHIFKKNELYTEKSFYEEFDISPEYWAAYTLMVGSHNNVPGIKGIGPKTATKIIKDPHKLNELISNTPDWHDKMDLIELPCPLYEPYVEIPSIKPFSVNYRLIAKFLADKGITMTARMMEAFDKRGTV